MISFKIIRTNRRDIKFSFKDVDSISIYIPKRMSQSFARQVIDDNLELLRSQLDKLKNEHKIKTRSQLENGDCINLLGKPRKIIIGKVAEKPKINDQGIILPDKTALEKRIILTKLYKKFARDYLTKRSEYYSPLLQVRPNKIIINQAQTRFGSCSSRKNVSFSFKIIMAPPEIIDYVVVHELIHLIHLNHSQSFWLKVQEIIPDYKSKKKWLKENGATLCF